MTIMLGWLLGTGKGGLFMQSEVDTAEYRGDSMEGIEIFGNRVHVPQRIEKASGVPPRGSKNIVS